MKLIVGIGNPGKEYENTRHNIGFIALDQIARKHNVDFNEKKFNSVYTTIRINGERVILTFAGDSPFMIVEETVSLEEEYVTIPVYGEPETIPITEECKIGGTTNPYGTTKLYIEQKEREHLEKLKEKCKRC